MLKNCLLFVFFQSHLDGFILCYVIYFFQVISDRTRISKPGLNNFSVQNVKFESKVWQTANKNISGVKKFVKKQD